MKATKANLTSEVNVKAGEFLLPECPNQPNLSFPKQTFGKQRRAFSPSWYSKYPWLHYVEAEEIVFFASVIARGQHRYVSQPKSPIYTLH